MPTLFGASSIKGKSLEKCKIVIPFLFNQSQCNFDIKDRYLYSMCNWLHWGYFIKKLGASEKALVLYLVISEDFVSKEKLVYFAQI